MPSRCIDLYNKMMNFEVKYEEESSPFLRENLLPCENRPPLWEFEGIEKVNTTEVQSRFSHFLREIGPIAETKVRKDVLLDCYAKGSPRSCDFVGCTKEDISRVLCQRALRMKKLRNSKLKWKEADFKALVWILSKYSDHKEFTNPEQQLESQDWKEVASLIPATTWQGCLIKWLSLKRSCLTLNNWSHEQSHYLNDFISRQGTMTSQDWKYISYKLYSMQKEGHKIFRSPKQCRQHFFSYLDPNVKKGKWTIQQDINLLRLVIDSKGMQRWSQIVNYLGGRTQNSIKNRYALILARQNFKVRGSTTELQVLDRVIKKLQKELEDKEKIDKTVLIKQECLSQEEMAEYQAIEGESGLQQLPCQATQSKLEEEYSPLKVESI